MTSIPTWLLPPPAEDAEEALRAKIIHWLALAALLFVIPLTVLLGVVEADVRRMLPLYGVTVLGAAGILVLVHRGWTRGAGVVFAALGWILTLWASFLGGGVGSPQLSLGVLVVMLTGFLWSGSAAIGMAIGISVSLAGLELAWDSGVLQEDPVEATRLTTWAALSTVLAMSAVFLQIFVRTVQSARDDAAEKSRRLEDEMKRRLETEASLNRAQKLEALGRLTGGIAHDFNNILTVLLGETELLEDRTAAGRALNAEEHAHVSEIRASAEQASALTRQLLAFSRHPLGIPDVMDPDRSIRKLEPMLRRLIREDISMKISTGANDAAVRIDSGQFQQVVMNLVLNASDAMPRGGDLVLATELVRLDEEWASVHPDTRPGEHLVLSVTDSGAGIEAADLERIFDPFFTTKAVGHGTGLGLASAHGIVNQAGGEITVETELGRGTTFCVVLPGATEATSAIESDPPKVAPGLGTLLLCEDDPAVRRVTQRALVRSGYQVLEADRGERALDLLRTSDRHIDLLVTDVIMPGMNGGELARLAAEVRPGIGVLLVSGYTSNVLEASGVPSDVELLEKPFTPAALLSRVAALINVARERSTQR
jgi:signal transduction histidine kinase/CheY-like chemotaxis protein